MQNILKDNPGRDGLRGIVRPIDLSPKWETGVVLKVRSVRTVGLAGGTAYEDSETGYVLEDATGVIELTGGREGAVRTCLIIGFSDAERLPPPTFELDEVKAVGTLSLRTAFFPAFLQIALLPNAHFKLASNGCHNALASDPSIFQFVQH